MAEEDAVLPEEEPLFKVIIILRGSYGTEIEGSTLEEIYEEAEESYEKTDIADFGIDGHSLHLIPLNDAARLLLQKNKEEHDNG